MMIKCPQCKSDRAVEGTALSQTAISSGLYFRPKGLRRFVFSGSDIAFKNRFYACLRCGLLWSGINPTKLASIITKKGRQKTKEKVRL